MSEWGDNKTKATYVQSVLTAAFACATSAAGVTLGLRLDACRALDACREASSGKLCAFEPVSAAQHAVVLPIRPSELVKTLHSEEVTACQARQHRFFAANVRDVAMYESQSHSFRQSSLQLYMKPFHETVS